MQVHPTTLPCESGQQHTTLLYMQQPKGINKRHMQLAAAADCPACNSSSNTLRQQHINCLQAHTSPDDHSSTHAGQITQLDLILDQSKVLPITRSDHC